MKRKSIHKVHDDSRISPRVSITMRPLYLAEGRRQAKAAGVTFSRHLCNLIEAESARNGGRG